MTMMMMTIANVKIMVVIAEYDDSGDGMIVVMV